MALDVLKDHRGNNESGGVLISLFLHIKEYKFEF